MKKALLFIGLGLIASYGQIVASTVGTDAQFADEMGCVGKSKEQSLKGDIRAINALAFLMENTKFVSVAYAVHVALLDIATDRPRLAGVVVAALIAQLEREQDQGARFSLRQKLVDLAGLYPGHAVRIRRLLQDMKDMAQGTAVTEIQEVRSLARDIERVKVPSPPTVAVEV